MRCPYCSAELAEDAVFCPYCMSPLKEKTKIPPLYGKHRAAGAWALCLLLVLLAAVSLFFLTRTRAPGQAPLPESVDSASLNTTETISETTEKTPSSSAESTAPTAELPTKESEPPAGANAAVPEPPAEETEQSAETLFPATESPAETLPAPDLYIYFAKVTLPRYSGELLQVRIDDVEWETVYNGNGTYMVKVILTVTNKRSSILVSGIPCFLEKIKSDRVYEKELIPGETVRVESVFSSVPGGSYTLTF